VSATLFVAPYVPSATQQYYRPYRVRMTAAWRNYPSPTIVESDEDC